jgi:alginate O-acetyltransferase complex protein AlgI
MWLLAITIYGGCKWLTFATSAAARAAGVWKSAGYLLLWTGMDAEAFFGRSVSLARPRWSEWAWAAGQAALGVWILLGVAPRASQPMIAGWLTMLGVVSILHFGVSQLLSLAWRTAGVPARHIMHKPLLAASLTDFWGRRWNLAFRDLMHRFVLRPLAPSLGMAGATMAVFVVSGIIHDVVISLAAGGGWGLPTVYFLIQGAGLLVERSRAGKRWGLARGWLGRAYAAAVVLLPVGLLFHRPFAEEVLAPMLREWLVLVAGG